LPKLIQVSLPTVFSFNLIFILLILTLILVNGVFGQIPSPSLTNRSLLPEKLPDNWRAIGPPQILTADQFLILPDGEVYTEYGLESLIARHYASGDAKISVEIFQMRFASGAYGLFTFNRGKSNGARQEFHVGRYFIRISGDDHSAFTSKTLTDFIKAGLTSDGELPTLPSHLPNQNKISDSEKYLTGPKALSKSQYFSDLTDIVNFDGGTEIATADYQIKGSSMGLMIVEYHTPQLTTDGYTKFQSFFEKLSDQEKKLKYLKRVGNYIVLAANVIDAADAENLIGQIKYNPSVSWEGKKISDIPLAFRPPDPVALEEASETAVMLLRTFYWVGIMLSCGILLGAITGGTIFYYKRYRRRKLGLEDIFSDAGGTVRLNLDDYLLQSADSSLSKVKKDAN